MKYPRIPLAQTIVELCKLKNIQHIIISPGSRNAPLTIGFTEDPYFMTYSIIDERCAAFFAMGIAQQTGKPAAVICTSGSALLNYYPAISEAFYSDIPLLVISADRPPYAIDIGDGQTIRQDNVFERHILYSANLKPDVRDNALSVIGDGKGQPRIMKTINMAAVQQGIQDYNEKEINIAIETACRQNGPVHINAPFEEPLYETDDSLCVAVKHIEFEENLPGLLAEELQYYADIWNTSAKKMILVGVNQPNAIEQELIDKLAQDGSVIIFTETTSNIYGDKFFPSIDKIIAPIEKLSEKEVYFEKLQPDVLLTFGGMVVSKKIKAFLRKFQPKHHWHVDTKKAYDTYYCLEKHIKVSPSNFFKAFLPLTSLSVSDYREYWLGIKKLRGIAHDKYLESIPYSDFKVFDRIFSSLPEGYQLQLSNSSTIRYAQLFDIRSGTRVFCNRGTSGIDGSTSTAIGASVVAEQPTLFLTGDLSFLYDSNGLWNNYTRKDFRIIIINNAGGGIFRILPGNKNTPVFDTYFETTHNHTAEHLARMHGYEYLKVSTLEALEESLPNFYDDSVQPRIMEVFTPRLENDEVLLNYFTFLAQN